MNKEHTTEHTLPHAKLHLHIQTPTLEDCWLDGYESAKHDIAEGHNPYRPSSKECEFWGDGWWAGLYDEKPLFDLAGHVYPEEEVEKPKLAEVIPITRAVEKHPEKWMSDEKKRLLKRTVQLATAIFVAAAAYEIADIAA